MLPSIPEPNNETKLLKNSRLIGLASEPERQQINSKLIEVYLEHGKTFLCLAIKDKVLLDLHKVLETTDSAQLR